MEKLEKMQQKHRKLILAQQQHLNVNKSGGENSNDFATSSSDNEMPCSSSDSNEALLSKQQKQFNDDPRFFSFKILICGCFSLSLFFY